MELIGGPLDGMGVGHHRTDFVRRHEWCSKVWVVYTADDSTRRLVFRGYADGPSTDRIVRFAPGAWIDDDGAVGA